MKNNRIVNWMPIGLLGLILLHAIISWIGNIYGWGLNNLFSQAGIRWTVANFIPNISQAPFAEIMLGLIAIGVATESGIFSAFGKNASLKQQRALSLAMLVLVLLVIIQASMVLIPNAILLSPFGTIADSPFSQGFYGILCVTAIIVSNVYGLSSGRFFSLNDTIKAHVSLMTKCLPCFLSTILTAVLMGAVAYSHLMDVFSLTFALFSWVLYLLPFVAQLIQILRS